MSGRRRLATVGIVAAQIAVTLVVWELILRAVYGGAEGSEELSPVAQLYVSSANPEIVFEHAPNRRIEFPAVAAGERSSVPWTVHTLLDGRRSNGGNALPPSALRGICLGDSTMFGVGVDDDETIPARLGHFVSADLGRPFSCLNFGVANYTTAQEVAVFRIKNALAFDLSVEHRA